MAEGKLTIRQIARLAGVSRSTVSRVINDHPNVSPETREQVLQVVAETGFRPDPIARSLSSRRADIIGLVIPLAIQSLFEDPFFPRLMQGISQGCNRHESMPGFGQALPRRLQRREATALGSASGSASESGSGTGDVVDR